jgi:hypothetical protein
MTHVHDREQPGWNAGYIEGEQERLALATALQDARSYIIDLQHEIQQLKGGT